MGTLSINQLKVGLTIDLEGAPYVVVNVEHVKPGKGSAFARTKLKSLKTGLVID
ncbi:MAG: elongation factor P, partial [Deltaproteobacteria bacterium]